MPILTDEIRNDPEKLAAFRAKNREVAKRFREKNRERFNAYARELRSKMKEHFQAADKSYYTEKYARLKADPDRLAKHRATRAKYAKWKRETDISFKLAGVLRKRICEVARGKRIASALVLLGCTMKEFRHHLEIQFASGMSWTNYGKGPGKWTIDHKVPCAAFDMLDPDQQKLCFHYTNLQPMWFEENCAKNSRVERDGELVRVFANN